VKKIIKFNKLIRDRIPEIIIKDGWMPIIKVLKNKEYLSALKNKMVEEVGELIKAKNKKDIINEIIDIQELLDALVEELKLSKLEIKNLQKLKNKKRGGFKKKLFLIREEKYEKNI
jgi:predicted house-cleaning noncanonical NTP pyrophosphatase (MazG superfamily)